MVIAGIGLISYPIINKSITNKQQKAMIEDVKKEILKNAKKNDSNEEVATEDDKNNIETESNIAFCCLFVIDLLIMGYEINPIPAITIITIIIILFLFIPNLHT